MCGFANEEGAGARYEQATANLAKQALPQSGEALLNLRSLLGGGRDTDSQQDATGRSRANLLYPLNPRACCCTSRQIKVFAAS